MLSQTRVDRVIKEMKERGLNQMLISDPVAIFWLTGKWIHPGERFFGLYISTGKTPIMFINALFQFEEGIGVSKVYFTDTDDIIPILKNHINSEEKLGVDKILPANFPTFSDGDVWCSLTK